MRTAVFSDVHGNLVALDALLAELERQSVDGLVCLGDALQGGAQPLECAERLAALGCPVVLGNADAFLLDLDPGREPVTEEQLDVARWSRDRLGERGLELIRGYAPALEVELGAGRTMLCCHGSPSSFDDLILPSTPEEEVRGYLVSVDADVVAGGHVHMQWSRPIAHRLLLNPGSVGLAYDHEQEEGAVRFEPWAQYAIVDSEPERLTLELRRVRFDPADVVATVEASGPPRSEGYLAGWR